MSMHHDGLSRDRVPPLVRDNSYWQALLAFVEHEAEREPAVSAEMMEGDEFRWTPVSAASEAWREAQEALEADEAFELIVTGYNKGGLLVTWRGLSGFVPASHLVGVRAIDQDDARAAALSNRVGSTVEVKLIEVSAENSRLIFSERAAQVDADTRQNLWEHITPGEEHSGVVTNLTDFGAFVDLGGVEGLIHISELSWSRLDHPSDIVEPGQEVSVKVLQVDRARRRVALSYKQTRPDPWVGIEERYRAGQEVIGVVRDVVAYGAFVTLERELEGLVHVSELAEGSFMHPKNVVTAGRRVRVRVLQVNAGERRMALSLKGVTQPPTQAT